MDRAEFFSTPNPRAWTPRTRADRPRSDHPSLSRRSIASDQDRNGYASTSPYGSPTRRSPPKDASPPRSPFDEERFQSIVGRRPGRRTSVDSAASSLRRGSLGSHSSISSMTENESAFDAGADDPASQSRLGVRHNASLSDLDHMHDNEISHGGSLGRESGASRASSIMSYASTISAGGGGSRARPPRDSNLPGAPGRFLAWLPRAPTLEGTLEKMKNDGYFGNTLRMLGMGTRGWKMRHFVLYDNHLFWGRGFSRMYGYGTVLSAYASPEDGETCFVLELVTHPKFSLRRGGLDSMASWQRLYGLCCSTHGYSRRLLRAGTVIDRDRWITAVTRGLPAMSSASPVSPAEAMLLTEEQSVFAVAEDGRRDSLDRGDDEDGPDPFAATPNTVRARQRKGRGASARAVDPAGRVRRGGGGGGGVGSAPRTRSPPRRRTITLKRRSGRANTKTARGARGAARAGNRPSRVSPDASVASEGFVSAASTPTAETHKNKKPPEASVVSGTTTTAFAHKPPAVPGSGRPLPQPSGSALRKSSSLAKKGGSEKSDGAGIFALAGLDIFGTSSATQTRGDSRRTTAADGDDDGSVPNSRKVKFRDEGGDPSGAGEGDPAVALESTVEYAPTPTKRNPRGVGKTSAKLAPFRAGGDEPDS